MYTSEIYIRTLSIKVSPGSINLCLLPNVGEAQVRYWKKGILQPINCRWNHSLIFYRQMFWWSLSWRSIKLLYLDSSKVIPRKTAHTTNGRIKEVCKKNGKKNTHYSPFNAICKQTIPSHPPFFSSPEHPNPENQEKKWYFFIPKTSTSGFTCILSIDSLLTSANV